MHYYQFNIGDYHSHTNHLDPLEDLAYRRMLDWCYLNEINLPDDVDEIARLIRMRPHTGCIAVVLRDFFTLTDEGYAQVRIQLEVSAYREKSAKAKKSAEARWNKKPAKTKGLGDANALRAQSEGNAKHKPLTTNHKPLNKEILIPDGINELAWKEWVDYRKSKRKPISQAAAKKQFKLLSNYAFDLQKQIIDQSIQNDYQGLFELKGNSNAANQPGRTTAGRKLSVVERTRQRNAEREQARRAEERALDGSTVGEATGNVWSPVEQPVRGDDTGELGTVIEGSCTTTD
jgi:uncharacterized protein YdaU (DUF1376 family)